MGWLRSVRTRILLLALVPMLSLFGLYVYTTSITARDALNLAHAGTVKKALGVPVGSYLAQVDTERPLAMVFLSAPSAGNLTALRMQGTRTDHAAQALRAALTSAAVTGNATPAEKPAIAVLLKDASRVAGLRAEITSGVVSRQAAFDSYNHVVSDADILLNQAIRGETNATVVDQGLAFVRMGQSQEMMLREAALLAGDYAARSFPAADRQQFAQLAGARRSIYALTLNDLDPAYRAIYTRDVSPQALASLTTLENQIISDPRLAGPPPVLPLAWEGAVLRAASGLTKAGYQAANAIDLQANHDAFATNLRVFLTGGAGLLAVLISILVAILTSRSLVRELTTLRRSALELANERLPQVVARLAGGEEVDLPSQAPGIPAKSDEIGQVRDAFAKVQQTAVEAAVGQARLREGISDVFRNLARRSQSLLHRQLTLLDTMERRASDPEQLADLFRIDHLTTRMRRHAESLIILSGQAPARGWRNPVPLRDVLRAAVAEIEDYTRIKVVVNTKAALAGPAVGDVIHMIAELVENATVFSPPNTPVVVSGDIVGQGFAVEIEDRGLGLTERKRAQANELLASPPAFDPSGTDQLGLFVASQLAKRHDIRISLRGSPYGGTTAIVLIPHALVVPEGGEGKEGAEPRGGFVPAGRHAGREDERGGGNGRQPAGWPAVARAYAPETLTQRPTGQAGWDLLAGTLGPGGGPAEAGEPAGTGTPPGTGIPAGNGAAGDTDAGLGLPRRVRQASLAPQLRASTPRLDPPAAAGLLAGSHPPGGPPGEGSAGAGPLAAPTPDETRATMSAIQRGWERGRSVFEPAGTTPPAAAAGDAAGTNGHAGHVDRSGPGEDGGPGGAEGLAGTGEPAAAGESAGGDGRLAAGDAGEAGEDGGGPAGEDGPAGESGLADALAASGADGGASGEEDRPVGDGGTTSDGGGPSGWS